MITYGEIEGMNGFMENLKCFDVLGLPKINKENVYGIKDVRLAFYNNFIINVREFYDGADYKIKHLIDLVDAYDVFCEPYKFYLLMCDVEHKSVVPIKEIVDPYYGYKKFYENDLQGKDLVVFFTFLKKIESSFADLKEDAPEAKESECAKYAVSSDGNTLNQGSKVKVGNSVVLKADLDRLSIDLTDVLKKAMSGQMAIEKVATEENSVVEQATPVDFYSRRLAFTKKKNN